MKTNGVLTSRRTVLRHSNVFWNRGLGLGARMIQQRRTLGTTILNIIHFSQQIIVDLFTYYRVSSV